VARLFDSVRERQWSLDCGRVSNHTGGMTPHDRQFAAQTLAPILLLISVAVAIVAQLGAPLPLAGAIALAAWGSWLAGSPSIGRLLVVLAVHLPIVAVAILSQLDAAEGASAGRQFVAAMDSGAATALLILLARRA
jgi:hypothetical protein